MKTGTRCILRELEYTRFEMATKLKCGHIGIQPPLWRALQPTNRPTVYWVKLGTHLFRCSPLLGSNDFEFARAPIEHCSTHVHLMSQLRVPGIYDIRGKL